MEDPRAETSGFKESTPGLVSYNKGQCNERLAQAVWARVIAKRRLARKVGSRSHSHNDKGETDCAALKETVSRLSFWILRITGTLDLEEHPDKVHFPNPKLVGR